MCIRDSISHSTLNYKDALAITGKSPVVRKFPMVPGIDFAGVVERSADPRFKPGDACLLYTSDAADDLLCVDLGGRRIIKKKKRKNKLINEMYNHR